ncbi:MAG TPA: hypothetical protein DCP91_00655 [Eggerthellaceae bacterium]|nr:hypothetical protein [Eggerthellaceae bacterium]
MNGGAMGESTEGRISRYIMHAFGRSTQTARIPRIKPDRLQAVTTARIVLSVQYDGQFKFIPYAPVDIRADSAEWYGYEDGIPYGQAPSMLDVITQAHEFILGDNFDEENCRELLDVDEDGILQRMLGVPGLFTCFVVNGQYSYDSESEYGRIGYRGLGYGETPVYDLDVVEVFSFPNSVGMDYYTYFMNPDGSWIRYAEVAPGQPITIRHEGFLFVIGGPYQHEDRIEQRMVSAIPQSQLAIVDTSTFELSDIPGAVTDEEGFVTFSLDEPGDYYITAHGGVPRHKRANLSLPWLPVIVR